MLLLLRSVICYVQAALKNSPGCLAMFCYSGHGASDGYQHYLLASDFTSGLDTDGLCIEQLVFNHMRQHAHMAIAVMDACRSKEVVHKGMMGSIMGACSRDPWLGTAHSTIDNLAHSAAAGIRFKDAAAGSGTRLAGLLQCWACSLFSKAADAYDETALSPYTGAMLKVRCPSVASISQCTTLVHNYNYTVNITMVLEHAK
jgi:hypothetical protein